MSTKFFTEPLYLLILFVNGLSAAEPQAIFYGSNLENNLVNPIDTHHYQLNGKAGDVIWIRAKDANSPVDASFQFLDSQGQILKKVTGSGGLVELFGFVINKDDTYTIAVYDHKANDAGRYALALHKLNQPGYAYGLVCGEDVTHHLPVRCAALAYRFNADAGEPFIIQAHAVNVAMETDLVLLNGSGEVVSKANIFSKNYAGWFNFIAPSTGSYTIFIFDRGGNDIGDVGFSIQSLQQSNCMVIPLACQSSQTAIITQLAEQHAFTIDHQNGRREVLMALVKNSAFELTLQLFNAQGQFITKQITSGKLNELWIDPALPSGQYLVVLSDDRANDLSEYSLFFHTIDETCVEPVNTCQILTGELGQHGEVVHYQFNVQPGAIVSATVKEIDTKIEPVAVLLDESYNLLARVSHSDKAQLTNIKISTGGILHLVVFDQGGNDLGRYKLEWLQSGDQNYSGPVAVCQPFLQKTLIGSEPVKITIAEIDLGSYDPCGSFKLEVSKSTFSCLDLGEQDITLTIRNEAGRTNTCKTRVTITSDLEVDFPSCLQVFPAYAPAACAKISPEVSGGAPTYSYLWNDLSKDEVLAVCPGTSTPYLVTVTDARGCSTSAQVMVEAIDISCGNNKVYLCHLPDGNPANAQTICISPNAVQQHLTEHVGCTLGPCGSTTCLTSNNIWFGGHSSFSSSISSVARIIPRGQQVVLPLQSLAPDLTEGSWSIHLVNTWGQPLAVLQVDAQNPTIAISQPGQIGSMLFARCLFHSSNPQRAESRMIVIPLIIQ